MHAVLEADYMTWNRAYHRIENLHRTSVLWLISPILGEKFSPLKGHIIRLDSTRIFSPFNMNSNTRVEHSAFSLGKLYGASLSGR